MSDLTALMMSCVNKAFVFNQTAGVWMRKGTSICSTHRVVVEQSRGRAGRVGSTVDFSYACSVRFKENDDGGTDR